MVDLRNHACSLAAERPARPGAQSKDPVEVTNASDACKDVNLERLPFSHRPDQSCLLRSPNSPPMGRQWLHAKREVANLKKGQAVGKLVKEIMVAAKLGGPDPGANARLFAASEKARKASVTRDVIER